MTWQEVLKAKCVGYPDSTIPTEENEFIQLKDVVPIIESLLKRQRESCLKDAEMGTTYNSNILEVHINRQSILNAPEPE